MTFTDAIIKEAMKWASCREDKGKDNRSYCVDKIHNYVRGYVSNDPWCAMFVTMVFDKVCKAFAIPNLIGLTAGTHDLLARGKKAGLKIDNIPKAGAIMFFDTTAKGKSASGHVGFVTEVNYNGTFSTIEGNSSDRVGFRVHDISSKYKFIHTEVYAGDSTIQSFQLQTAGMNKYIVIGLIGYLSYYFYNKQKD